MEKLRIIVFVFIIGVLFFNSCESYNEQFGDKPYYITMGDTLEFVHEKSYSDSEGGSSSYSDVTVFEDPSFGFSSANKIKRLKIIEVNSSKALLIPLLTGETTLVIKTVSQVDCLSCLDGKGTTYNNYSIIITP